MSKLEAYTDIINGYTDFVSKIAAVCGPEVVGALDKNFLVLLMRAKSQIYDKVADIEDEMERTEFLVNNILALIASIKYITEDELNVSFD